MTIGPLVYGSYCSISVWATDRMMWHNDFAEFQMDHRTGANFIEQPIEMPGQYHQRPPTMPSTSAWLKLTLNYTEQPEKHFTADCDLISHKHIIYNF